MIIIDLEDTYEPSIISKNLDYYIFKSKLKNNDLVDLHVYFEPYPDKLLPDVYNLSFGPLKEGVIDDNVKLPHSNTNKVFSTLILFVLTFLQQNPEFLVGIDGSNEVRAYLYHRMFITNTELMKEYFKTIGVDWYVRLLRNGNIETDENGQAFFKPRLEPFDIERSSKDLYRYYLVALNTNN